jgi:hypothetical protein
MMLLSPTPAMMLLVLVCEERSSSDIDTNVDPKLLDAAARRVATVIFNG